MLRWQRGRGYIIGLMLIYYIYFIQYRPIYLLITTAYRDDKMLDDIGT
jgi:hypothetical protein